MSDSKAKPIGINELPRAITSYLHAHRTGDIESAIGAYHDDATVTDDGKNYRGITEIRRWLTRSASEYNYTTELVAAERIDDSRYIATNHLEGNFPGGTIDLQYRFTMRNGRIADLAIQP